MIGSQAPGRIERVFCVPSAFLVKQIGSRGIFYALAIAFHIFETRKELGDAFAELTRRAKARPVVFKAILGVMAHLGIGDDEAYQLLRA
jgi:AmiR/NasT family two-component response regulator